MIRSTTAEKDYAIASLAAFQERNRVAAQQAGDDLQRISVEHENVFAAMMEAAKVSSLGQISGALYLVGGQYRRNM